MTTHSRSCHTRIVITGLRDPAALEAILKNHAGLFRSVEQTDLESLEAVINDKIDLEVDKDEDEMIRVIMAAVQELGESSAQMGTFKA